MTVYIRKCDEYNETAVKENLLSIFDSLGGLENIFKKGMKVALKPNLLMPKKPDEAATTHPVIVKTLAELIISTGAVPFIIDSPGGPYTVNWLKATYSASKMTEISKSTGLELNFDLGSRQLDIDKPLIMEKVQILKPLLEADYIINIPKLKTHGMMVMTGAVKNMFGAVPGEIKAEYHMNYPNYNDFAMALIDVFSAVKPDLNIMDAVYAMDGFGPSGGKPYKLALIMASKDACALDIAGAKLMGLSIEDVPILDMLKKNGLTDEENEVPKIDGVEDLLSAAKDFSVPMKGNIIESFIFKSEFLKTVLKLIRAKPVIIRKNCTNCNTCVEICPVKTIDKTDNYPDIKLDKCIRCFCCQELCPQSTINIKRYVFFDTLVKLAAKLVPLLHRRMS